MLKMLGVVLVSVVMSFAFGKDKPSKRVSASSDQCSGEPWVLDLSNGEKTNTKMSKCIKVSGFMGSMGAAISVCGEKVNENGVEFRRCKNSFHVFKCQDDCVSYRQMITEGEEP